MHHAHTLWNIEEKTALVEFVNTQTITKKYPPYDLKIPRRHN